VPTIVIRHPNGTTEERDVTGKLTVGCDDGNDLVLRAGGVSQRHAQFFADGGELVLENVGSAAATLVDGESIGRPTKLRAGVKVRIGEYEVQLKPDQAQMVVRKLSTPTAASTLTDEAPVPRRATASGFPLLIAAAVGGLLLLCAVVVVLARRHRPPVDEPPAVVDVTNDTPKPDPSDPCSDVEGMLKPAREKPSDKSLSAALAVLECDPLNKEAGQLRVSIQQELKAAAAAERGSRLVDLGHDAEGLAALKEIPPGTPTFVSSQPLALAVAARVEKAASEQCKTYSKESRWVQAAPACEQAMQLHCQSMTRDELTARKPKEPLLVMLLKAREKVDPHAPPWSCLATPILKPLLAAPEKVSGAGASTRQSTDPQINAALALYAKGSIDAAIVQLQKVKEKSEKAAVHAEAEQLRAELVTIDSLEKIGLHDLEAGELDKAAKTLREALERDAKVMLAPGAPITELDRQPSGPRRSIVTSAAQQALRFGVAFAQRQDLKKGCAAWKMGFSFYRGNSELNEALNTCSTEAKRLLDSARACPDLVRASELAVPGDTLAEAIAARKTELGCP
jgi:pSer/pThr/pTyr-binding forkhead associated (FHA) protein